jgi:endonuclease-3
MKSSQVSKTLSVISESVGDAPSKLTVEWVATALDPYAVLVATILSLRCNDKVTNIVFQKLWERAKTPHQMVNLSVEQISEIIYSISFHNTKARTIREISEDLIARHGGLVPNSFDGLLRLKGVGRKSANLVLTLAFKKPGICVDTHVFRISNRIGFVQTKSAEQTEFELRKILDPQWWIPINGILIAFGKTQCTPVMPRCSSCCIQKSCQKIGVGRRQ